MSVIRYTKDHEWIRVEGDVGVVGITDFAQSQLGDIVFIDLPDVGGEVVQGGEVAVVESVKAASEVYSPVSGEVIAVNSAVVEEPGVVNNDPMGQGWFFKIRLENPEEINALMDEDAYQGYYGKDD
ncbi:glycine cleavage system H protein [Azospirillaceae bacterium]